MKYLLLSFLIVFSLLGCNEFCEQEVEDITYLENQTGSSLSLEVCLGSEVGVRTLDIETHQEGRFSLGGREITYENNDLGAGCNREEGEELIQSAKLTNTHFSSAKFCHPADNTSNTVIVQSSASCPGGTVEQATASNDCSSNEASTFDE